MKTFDRETGVKAIIYLQSLVGITETQQQAELGWDRMTNHEREQTMLAYAMLGTPTR